MTKLNFVEMTFLIAQDIHICQNCWKISQQEIHTPGVSDIDWHARCINLKYQQGAHIRWYAGSIGSCTVCSPSLPFVLRIRLIKSWNALSFKIMQRDYIIPEWLMENEIFANFLIYVKIFDNWRFKLYLGSTAPASLLVCNVPQSRRTHSQKARRSCSLTLAG